MKAREHCPETWLREIGETHMTRLRPAHILLVDDNPDDVVVTRRVLKRSHIANQLDVVRDGREALDFIFRTGSFGAGTLRPDLILLDLKLPRFDGVEVLARIRENPETASIPVVMLTGSSRPANVTRTSELGATTYIQKPVEIETLLQALEVLGEYWIAIETCSPEVENLQSIRPTVRSSFQRMRRD